MKLIKVEYWDDEIMERAGTTGMVQGVDEQVLHSRVEGVKS
jgi:hypothetical protein